MLRASGAHGPPSSVPRTTSLPRWPSASTGYRSWWRLLALSTDSILLRPRPAFFMETGNQARVAAHRDAAEERQPSRNQVDAANVLGAHAQIHVAEHGLGNGPASCLAEDPLPSALQRLGSELQPSREGAAGEVITGRHTLRQCRTEHRHTPTGSGSHSLRRSATWIEVPSACEFLGSHPSTGALLSRTLNV